MVTPSSGILGGGSAQVASGSAGNDPARVREAACQFESLLLGQMMKSAHQADQLWSGEENDDQSGETATELAKEQFAQALARQGGLSLARMVIAGLNGGESGG